VTAAPIGTLSSEFDADRGTIEISIELDAPQGVGWRLAFTSVVQIMPGPTATLVERLATYHVVEPSEPPAPVASGRTWSFVSESLSHRPHHANDGPASAYLIDASGATHELAVDPMRTNAHHRDDWCLAPIVTRGDVVPLVPYPVDVRIAGDAPGRAGTARLAESTGEAAVAWAAVADLAERMTGAPVLGADGAVTVRAVVDPARADEGYGMEIDGSTVTVSASGAPGFRHALVTLAKWLPHGLPERATIHDQPAFAWRGLHIDLARQWFEPDLVERLIDEAAWLKLSRLHLHLTDDEAWRMPVDGYPALTEIGATRGHGLALPPMLGDGPGPSGRAYTEDEIARWVSLADALGVVLVPELDVPAHNHATLAALPELRDPGDTSDAVSVQYFTDNVLVPGRAETDRFIEAAFTTAARLFPSSPWLHLGGDEVPDGAWRGSPTVQHHAHRETTREIEARFHRSVVEVVRERLGRSVGAWQEAAESGGVAPGDGYAIGWRTVEANLDLARAGHDVVISPGQAYYLDMADDDAWDSPGANWAGSTSLDDVVAFDPAEGWTADERERLLGVQACLWTEFVHDEAALRDRLFPRLDAIAERAWTGNVVGGAGSLLQRAGRD